MNIKKEDNQKSKEHNLQQILRKLNNSNNKHET